uniref:Coiled-coil domain-containing protein 174 n=1 Tax=Ceratitis capitata TaxID=7213 RepID=W8BN91_CERCA
MNDPNKAINVNLSSLLSLKAELLRKQTEVNKAKATQAKVPSQHNEYTSHAHSSNSASVGDSHTSKQNKKIRSKEVRTGSDVTIYEHEDSELLEKSKRVLEAKSKFYERMTRTGGQLNSDDNCLVLFNRKHQDERVDDKSPSRDSVKNIKEKDSDSDSSAESENDKGIDDDDEWVEYTDCLGRTRKCLHKDLEMAKKRDAELAASMPERLDQSKPNWMINNTCDNADNEEDGVPFGPLPTESLFGDGISTMSKHDEQRANWERKEQENLDKIDVHYQDVFFDEARQHGVGYYTFSTDEEERKKQQKELEEARKRTIDEQKRRDQLREQREKIIADRVLAAKNRQRARLGLPPLAKDEEKEKAEGGAEETKEERKARKRAEKLKRKQDELEKERELERQKHVRPWDKEKELTDSSNVTEDLSKELHWAYKPERLPMSQEQWNEKKRAERVTEFAPMNELKTQSLSQPKRKHFTSMPPPPQDSYSVDFVNNTSISSATDNFAS